MDSGLCQQNLNSGFQSLVGFRIPRAVFGIQKPRIPDSTSKILLDSGFHKQKFPGFRNPGFLAREASVCSKSRATVLMSFRCGVLAFSTSRDKNKK